MAFGAMFIMGLVLTWYSASWQASALVLLASLILLPETLPSEDRQPFSAANVMRMYGEVLGNRLFWLVCLSLSANFIGFFLYAAAAPVFLTSYLRLGPQEFG